MSATELNKVQRQNHKPGVRERGGGIGGYTRIVRRILVIRKGREDKEIVRRSKEIGIYSTDMG